MPKVSVIIPVYKVEAFLSACLDSVDRQTYRDFELILVDDGSPDSCGAMCDAYAETHPNTRVIHQENVGLSEARNRGAKVSSGEYIVFIDSDDYVSEDYIEHLLQMITEYDADVSVAKATLFEDGKPAKTVTESYRVEVLSAEDALKKICYNTMPICAWGKMYKREAVLKHPYPKGCLYEDTATTHRIVGDAKRVVYSNRHIYFWRQRSGSITHEVVTEKHLYGIDATKEQLEYMKKHYPGVVPAARARCVMKIVDLAYRLVMGQKNTELFACVRAEIKPFIKPLLSDPKAGLSIKIRALILNSGYIPYLLLSKVYFILKRERL